jgi:hypothetical protein
MDSEKESGQPPECRTELVHRECKTLTAALNYCADFGLPNPWERFCQNRSSARARKIEWKLTFDQWWDLWEENFHKRGLGAGKMNLCRSGDVGAYVIGNVRVDTCEANQLEMLVNIEAKLLARRIARAAEPPRRAKHFKVNLNTEYFEQSMSLADPLEILLAKEAINAL